MITARVQAARFAVGDEVQTFTDAASGAGAVVSFTGVVRDDTGDLQHMMIEHYPGMTEQALRTYADQAAARFGLTDVLVIHRFGQLAPGETIMMVATASRHRVAAFEGAMFLMDYLKSRAPFWKKEIRADGADWVQARDADEDALKTWNTAPG